MLEGDGQKAGRKWGERKEREKEGRRREKKNLTHIPQREININIYSSVMMRVVCSVSGMP